MMTISIDGQLLEKTRDGIKTLAGTIEGIDLEEKVIIQEVPQDQEGNIPDFPFIPVWLLNTEIYVDADGTNKSDIIVYPIGVAILDTKQAVQESFAEFDRRLFWRQKMMDHFIHTRVTISPDVVSDTIIIPGPRVDQSIWRNRQKFGSWFVIQYRTCQQRRV